MMCPPITQTHADYWVFAAEVVKTRVAKWGMLSVTNR